MKLLSTVASVSFHGTVQQNGWSGVFEVHLSRGLFFEYTIHSCFVYCYLFGLWLMSLLISATDPE